MLEGGPTGRRQVRQAGGRALRYLSPSTLHAAHTPGPHCSHPNDSVDPTRCSGHVLMLVSSRWRRCTSVPMPPAHRPSMTAAATSCRQGAGRQGRGHVRAASCALCLPLAATLHASRQGWPKGCRARCAAATATSPGWRATECSGRHDEWRTHAFRALHNLHRGARVVGSHELQRRLAGGADAGGHPQPLKVFDAAGGGEGRRRG